MGYSHYIWRARDLDREHWREWVAGDIPRIIHSLPAQVPLSYYPLDGSPITVRAPLIVAGPLGDGYPRLTREVVSFNGGGWVDVNGHSERLGCETFNLNRYHVLREWDDPDERGWYFECCKTRQLPYDLAVTASLVRLAHRFPEGVEIGSDGGPEDWQPAIDLCREVFGHAELPFPVGEPPDRAAGPDHLNELLAKRDCGTLAPHEVGELRELLDRDLEAEASDLDTEAKRRLDAPGCEP